MSDPFDVFVFKVGQNKPTRKQPNTRQPTLFPRVGVTHRHHPYPYPSSIPSTSASTSPSASAFSQFPSNPEMASSPPTSPPMMSPIEELGTFSSCEVSDALVKLGLTHNASERPVQRGGCIPDIQMLSPSPHDMVGQNRRICGYAYTVKMVRGDDVQAPKPPQHFVDAAPAGCVAVISVPPNIKSAAWGGLMTAGAQFRGVHGVVIDGRARDLVEHRASGFPVFARGSSTLGQSPFTRPSELNVPITILPRPDFENHFENTFSAVEVHPGDAIVADIDGVVCVPRELIGKVLDSCRYSKEVDERCAIDIRQGRGIQETFQLWRKATTGRKRLLSPAAALANSTSPKVNPGSQSPTAVSPRVAARNILKSTLSLVPRTLVNEQQLLWEQRVRSALDDLETGKSRPLRVAVWGDGLSGASEIVTGLLDDPLSDDLDQRSMLRQRWASVQQSGSIHIKRTELASWDGSILGIKSNWLRNINAEIIECRDINALDTLLSCDHVILVTDNLRRLSAPGLQEILRGLVHAPSVKLVVTERAPGVPAPSDDLEKSKSALVKPEIAVQGLEAFSRGDVNEYQTLLMASGLPQFAREITERYAQSNQPSSSSSSASIAMVRTAAHIARTTLSTCDAAINGAQESLSTTVAPVEPLKAEVSAVGPAALKSVLQGTTTVREGVSVAEARLRAAYERLPWYSLWWRADEVASTLRETITWGSLDTQLSFHAGRLASIRQHLYGKAVALSVSSPVLKNQLAQLNARTPIGPDALSSPLAQRTAQLLAPGGPVEDVQRRAQAAVVATSANIVGSGVLSAGLFAIGSIGAGTAVGAGLLGAVGSVRWMQSMWSNAEKKWWADWGRVCAGLERDCEATLNEVVRERVVKSAVVGIQGVEALATQRAKTISTLKVELSGLSRELGNLEQRLG